MFGILYLLAFLKSSTFNTKESYFWGVFFTCQKIQTRVLESLEEPCTSPAGRLNFSEADVV